MVKVPFMAASEEGTKHLYRSLMHLLNFTARWKFRRLLLALGVSLVEERMFGAWACEHVRGLIKIL